MELEIIKKLAVVNNKEWRINSQKDHYMLRLKAIQLEYFSIISIINLQ